MADNAINVFDVQRLIKYHADHGFDLSHPQGVVVHGKLYPTLNKHITHMNFETGEGMLTSAEIPVESGNIVHLEHLKDFAGIYQPYKKNIYAHLYTPVTHITGDNDVSHTYSSYGEGTILNADNAHDRISKLLNIPSSGYIGHINSRLSPMAGTDYVAHARAFSASEQRTPSMLPRRSTRVDIGPNGEIKSHLLNKHAEIRVPRGHLHVESMGYDANNKHTYTPQHYAYDPVNETLKRAEVE